MSDPSGRSPSIDQSATNGAGTRGGSPVPVPAPVRVEPVPPPVDPRVTRNWMRAILPSALFGIMGLVAGLSTGHNGVATRALFAGFCALAIVVLCLWARRANAKLQLDASARPVPPPRDR